MSESVKVSVSVMNAQASRASRSERGFIADARGPPLLHPPLLCASFDAARTCHPQSPANEARKVNEIANARKVTT